MSDAFQTAGTSIGEVGQQLAQAMGGGVDYTFNWFYADNKHIAYFNSGNNPVRHKGVVGQLHRFLALGSNDLQKVAHFLDAFDLPGYALRFRLLLGGAHLAVQGDPADERPRSRGRVQPDRAG